MYYNRSRVNNTETSVIKRESGESVFVLRANLSFINRLLNRGLDKIKCAEKGKKKK